MSYQRVLPRDLFNEAKLLKCLGQLSLILHDREGWLPLSLEMEDDNAGFPVLQDPNSGDIFCSNLTLVRPGDEGEQIALFCPLNSREPYPLLFADLDDEYHNVFNDDGSLTDDFVNYAKRMKIPEPEPVTSKEQARDLAAEWQHWQSERSMSYHEMAKWHEFFSELAQRFDLTEEFTENGII